MKIARFLIILLLVSCGGGGGSESSNLDQTVTINPVINIFTSSSDSIAVSSSVDLTWTTTNTVSCSASGDWNGSKSLSGSENLILSDVKTYTFTLTCRCEDPQNNISKSIDVEVSSINGSDIYSEDKASYCKDPINNSSSYWIENFDSNIFNEDIFTYQLGNGFNASDGSWVGGWGNNELQYYTGPGTGYAKKYNSATNTTENLFIENGYLKIQPIYNTSNVFQDPYCADGSCSFEWPHTSARVITSSKKIFEKPSRITICFKVPDGTGHWPAIWMLGSNITTVGWPACGEVDIMEHWGNNQNFVSSAIHTPSSSGNTINKGGQTISTVSSEFHVYALEWTEEKMVFSVDDVVHYTYNPAIKNADTWPFDNDQIPKPAVVAIKGDLIEKMNKLHLLSE